MIIKALLDLIYNVLSVLLVISLPSMPETVTSVINQVLGYMVTGISVIRVFIGQQAMMTLAVLLALILALNAAYFLYSFVFWVIRKIPMLNVRE